MKALILDFDGTILDTEQCELAAWQYIFAKYRHTFPLEEWHACVGTGNHTFDPFLYLQTMMGKKLNDEIIHTEREQKKAELLATLEPLPGVINWITTSKKLGLKLAIASNSAFDWVGDHLKQLHLLDYFDVIVTADQITHLKPHPEIYQSVLNRLNISADQAIAIEDSHHGVSAALAAGIRCIAVPNKILAKTNFPQTFALVESLAELAPEAILKAKTD